MKDHLWSLSTVEFLLAVEHLGLRLGAASHNDRTARHRIIDNALCRHRRSALEEEDSRRACRAEHRTFLQLRNQVIIMIILGIILAIVGVVISVPVLLYVGIALVVIGAVLEIMGSMGHAVAGRRHYY